jgi:alpha-N-acetylglucosamine transferase
VVAAVIELKRGMRWRDYLLLLTLLFYSIMLLSMGYICSMRAEKQEVTGRKQLSVVLEAIELETAKKVAKKRGVSTSSLVRMLILDEARRLGIE